MARPPRQNSRAGETEAGFSSSSDSGGGLNISARLKRMYDSYRDEEIPQHLLDLLEKIDAAEAKAEHEKKDGGKDGE